MRRPQGICTRCAIAITCLCARIPAGAGWGGCAVFLVREPDAGPFLAALREQYFGPLLKAGRVTEGEMGDVLFASPPSSGAAVLRVKLAPPEVEQEEAPAREAEPVAA